MRALADAAHAALRERHGDFDLKATEVDVPVCLVEFDLDPEKRRLTSRATPLKDATELPRGHAALDLGAFLRRENFISRDGAPLLAWVALSALIETLEEPYDSERDQILEMLLPRHELLFGALARWTKENAEQTPAEGADSGPRPGVWWRIDARKTVFFLEPVERSPGRKGGLTPGRHIDPFDVKRMRSARASDHEAADLYERGLCPLLALVDADNVVDSSGTPVAVQRASLELALVETAAGFVIEPRIAGVSLRDGIVFGQRSADVLAVFDESSRRVVIAPVDPAQRRLIDVVAKSDPVPEKETERLLHALEAVAAKVSLKLPEKLMGETIEVPRMLVVRIAAAGADVISLRIGVRPVPEGAVIEPGVGSEILGGVKDQKRVRFRRALDVEVKDADALRERLCPGHDGWRLLLAGEDGLAALEALGEARLASNPPLEVEAAPDLVRVKKPIPADRVRVRVSRLGALLGIEGELRDDEGDKVDLDAALVALRLGRRYVKIADGRFARMSDELAARLRPLADLSDAASNHLAVPLEAAFAIDALAELGVEVTGDEAWKKLKARVALGRDVDGKVSRAVRAELRPYQEEGVRFLRRLEAWGVGGVLADDMGLGKTIQAIALLADRSSGPQLVVAPTSVAFNWVREIERFAPGLRPVLYGGRDRASMLSSLEAKDVLVTSYALVTRDAQALAAVAFKTLVLDEAHAIKNASTQRARAVRDLNAEWRFGLTGTPLENHTGELWSLFSAVAPGLLGTQARFREHFAVPIENDGDVERRRALSRVVRPFLLRRKKSEVALDLPPRSEMTLLLDQSPDERAAYEALRTGILAWMRAPIDAGDDDEIKDRRFRALAALTKLRLAACAPALADGSATTDSTKAQVLLKHLEELREGGHRALVFSQFVKHLDLVQPIIEAAGFRALRLDGSTAQAERVRVVDAFQAGEADCFFLSVTAGGIGLNLTRASYVFHLDPWWNPAVEEQATGRAHRIGQVEPVTVIRFVARGTVEDAILGLHAEKRNLVDGVLEGTEAAAKLSYDEMIDLISAGTSIDQAETADTSAPSSLRRPRGASKQRTGVGAGTGAGRA
jgi:superfamily II DNA or RNA helicase